MPELPDLLLDASAECKLVFLHVRRVQSANARQIADALSLIYCSVVKLVSYLVDVGIFRRLDATVSNRVRIADEHRRRRG